MTSPTQWMSLSKLQEILRTWKPGLQQFLGPQIAGMTEQLNKNKSTTKETRIYNREKAASSTNDVRKIESYMCKNHAGLLFHTAFKNNSKWFRGLYAIPKITKLSEESCMVCFWTLVLAISLAMSLQTRETKAKVNDGTTTKISHYKWNEQTTYWM